MFKEALNHFTDSELIILAMIIFMVIFVVNMAILFFQNNKSELKYLSEMPLENGGSNE